MRGWAFFFNYIPSCFLLLKPKVAGQQEAADVHWERETWLTSHASGLWLAVLPRWFLTNPHKLGIERADFITDPFSHLLLSGHRQFEQAWQKASYKPTIKEPTVQNKHWTEINGLCLHANGVTRVSDCLVIKTPPTLKRSRCVRENQRSRTVSSWTCWADNVWWKSAFSALELVNKQNFMCYWTQLFCAYKLTVYLQYLQPVVWVFPHSALQFVFLHVLKLTNTDT